MSERLLVVTAVEIEAEAVRTGLRSTTTTVAAVGVGSAAAAAGTARILAMAASAGRPHTGVVSAGIGGGFTDRIAVGGTVLGSRSIAADLGAESPAGFIPLDELGFGAICAGSDPGLLARLRVALPHATVGAVLTVNTVTGSARTARELAARHPDALAEAMEGYGVACAALNADLPFIELRTVSNPIGPRDRAAWRIRDALDALTTAAAGLSAAGLS